MNRSDLLWVSATLGTMKMQISFMSEVVFADALIDSYVSNLWLLCITPKNEKETKLKNLAMSMTDGENKNSRSNLLGLIIQSDIIVNQLASDLWST